VTGTDGAPCQDAALNRAASRIFPPASQYRGAPAADLGKSESPQFASWSSVPRGSENVSLSYAIRDALAPGVRSRPPAYNRGHFFQLRVNAHVRANDRAFGSAR